MAKNPERSPAMQFYFRQFAGDETVQVMDLDAVGAHILLMCMAGASAELFRVPSDERKLRAICRNPSEADWARIREQLLDGPWKVSEDGRWWLQRGMMRTFLKQKAFHASASERGKMGAAARWGDGSANGRANSNPMAEAMAKHGSASASASASANLRESPLPPAGAGETEMAFAWGAETILVRMGRHRRLPSCVAYAGGRASDVAEYFTRKGFPARVASGGAGEKEGKT